MSSLREQLVADSEYFKHILSMIPEGYCVENVDDNVSETQSSRNTRGEMMMMQIDRCDDLRDRLHQKVDELQSKRKKEGVSLDPAERRRQKRRESKAKLRDRRRSAKQKNKEHSSVNNTSVKSETLPKRHVFNKDDKMVFSKFNFNEISDKKKNKSDDVPTGKNYKVLLKQVKKKKEKMSEMEATDKEQAQEMTAKQIWKAALLKAEGVKLKDDPELLKKAMKRREQKKKSSQQKWEGRQKTLSKQMKDRQDKRAKNIAKKKEGRANKKIQKAKKRGRVAV